MLILAQARVMCKGHGDIPQTAWLVVWVQVDLPQGEKKLRRRRVVFGFGLSAPSQSYTKVGAFHLWQGGRAPGKRKDEEIKLSSPFKLDYRHYRRLELKRRRKGVRVWLEFVAFCSFLAFRV